MAPTSPPGPTFRSSISAGRPVPVEVKQPAGQVLKLSVDEGVYTVRGRFVVDNDTI